jgi:hypothetical protein
MAWDGDLSVAVGEPGHLYTGNNFYGWLPQVTGTTNDLQAVAFFGNRIVIAGAEGTVGYSDDGVNFNISFLNTTNWLVSLAASPTLIVAVGDNAVIYSSTDGASWQLESTPKGVGANWLLGAAWGGGEFVITGENGYTANSSDGLHWTNHSSGVTSDLTRVAHVSTTNSITSFPYTGF